MPQLQAETFTLTQTRARREDDDDRQQAVAGQRLPVMLREISTGADA